MAEWEEKVSMCKLWLSFSENKKREEADRKNLESICAWETDI